LSRDETRNSEVNGKNPPERYDSFGDPRYDSCLRLNGHKDGKNPLSLPPRSSQLQSSSNPDDDDVVDGGRPSASKTTSQSKPVVNNSVNNNNSINSVKPTMRLSGSVDDVAGHVLHHHQQSVLVSSTGPAGKLSNSASLNRPHHRSMTLSGPLSLSSSAAPTSNSNLGSSSSSVNGNVSSGAAQRQQQRPVTMYASNTLPGHRSSPSVNGTSNGLLLASSRQSTPSGTAPHPLSSSVTVLAPGKIRQNLIHFYYSRQKFVYDIMVFINI
jgi:hypothetical protein